MTPENSKVGRGVGEDNGISSYFISKTPNNIENMEEVIKSLNSAVSF